MAIHKLDTQQVESESISRRNMLLEDFVHITSHNLQGPVSNLKSLLHAWDNTESPDVRQEIYSRAKLVINQLSDTLTYLIEELKIRDNKNIHYELVDFSQALQNAITLHSVQIDSSHAVINSDFSKMESVATSKKYMESILYNLLNNAIKYRHPGRRPEIFFSSSVLDHMVVIECSDNGLGFDVAKNQANLFRLQKTFHKHPKAKGVGLYLTRAHVEVLGGWMSVESQIDQGSTFKIFLPLKDE